MRAVLFAISYFILIQFPIGYLIPRESIFHYRPSYQVIWDNPRNIDIVLQEVRETIRERALDKYIIILGDSVPYSAPGGPEQSIGYLMERIGRARGRPTAVFNLAIPAMQAGDLYVMLLKLRRQGISTENVIINVTYAGFVARDPDPAAVFWLADDLARVDPEAYDRVRANLAANGRARTPGQLAWMSVSDTVLTALPVTRYRDYLRASILRAVGLEREDQAGEILPWYSYPDLRAGLQRRRYQRAFDPLSFVMDDTNPQVYFLEKIVALEGGENPLFFLTPINRELMRENVSEPGYRENLARIDAYFAGKPVRYLNLHDAIDPDLFHDHVHLTPEGYRKLALLLWEASTAGPR